MKFYAIIYTEGMVYPAESYGPFETRVLRDQALRERAEEVEGFTSVDNVILFSIDRDGAIKIEDEVPATDFNEENSHA